MNAILTIAACLAIAASPSGDSEVAQVLGKPITLQSLTPTHTAGASPERIAMARELALQSMIWTRLRNDYVHAHGITATPQEIDTCVKTLFETPDVAEERKKYGLPPPNDQERKMQRSLAESEILSWKFDAALYAKYGGAVIFQQSNPQEPIEAERKFLEEAKQQGKFKIEDPDLRAALWDYFNQPVERPLKHVDFSKPWWLEHKP